MNEQIPPWQSRSEWEQIEQFLQRSCLNKPCLSGVLHHVEEIAGMVVEVDGMLEDLCSRTCTSCAEPCCGKATIWYDFRDLLFFYMYYSKLPEQQIVRSKGQGCPHLKHGGCELPRLQRPFICTWYICAEQSSKLAVLSEAGQDNLLLMLTRLKEARKLMEQKFLQCVGENSRNFMDQGYPWP